jgi:hypothetical protein
MLKRRVGEQKVRARQVSSAAQSEQVYACCMRDFEKKTRKKSCDAIDYIFSSFHGPHLPSLCPALPPALHAQFVDHYY